jgi:hypothetical protein
MNMSPGWQVMQEGVVFLEFNHQGGPRGGDEFAAPNWWMGMASRATGHGQLTLTGMLSLDAATLGGSGYREIFQAGESLDGRPIVDRQHPHDFFMQLSAAWRIPMTSDTGLTLVAAPAGEPALGPVAFMHRASATGNPTAPLSHHTFDSTHVSYGVLTAAIDRGRWMLEGSVFNGREPDDQRWNFDFGRLDSVSARLWFRPAPSWELQVSTGHLKSPEALEPGNVERSTASVAWTKAGESSVTAFTVGYGRNDADHGARQAVFIEGLEGRGLNVLYQRLEGLQVETALLQTGALVDGPAAPVTDPVLAFTFGGIRSLPRVWGVTPGLGADVTVYRVPSSLDGTYGARPVSFHVFLEVGFSAGTIGRMLNMRMGQPMGAGAHE